MTIKLKLVPISIQAITCYDGSWVVQWEVGLWSDDIRDYVQFFTYTTNQADFFNKTRLEDSEEMTQYLDKASLKC